MIYRRFCIVEFDRLPSNYFPPPMIKVSNIDVHFHLDYQENHISIVMYADSTLDYDATIKASIDSLKKVNTRIEKALEQAASLTSVLLNTSHSLYSSVGCFALKAENTNDNLFIKDLSQIKETMSIRPLNLDKYLNLNQETIDLLKDRLTGVTSLSEVFSVSNRPISQYKELTRFFEMAFGRQFTVLQNTLFSFFKDSKLQYTKTEIQEWLKKRNGIAHADGGKGTIYYERDVAPYITRMIQAAVIVLMTKKDWGKGTIDKRFDWVPSTRFIGVECKIECFKCVEVTFGTPQITDIFGSWLFHPEIGINFPLDEEWWRHVAPKEVENEFLEKIKPSRDHGNL